VSFRLFCIIWILTSTIVIIECIIIIIIECISWSIKVTDNNEAPWKPGIELSPVGGLLCLCEIKETMYYRCYKSNFALD